MEERAKRLPEGILLDIEGTLPGKEHRSFYFTVTLLARFLGLSGS